MEAQGERRGLRLCRDLDIDVRGDAKHASGEKVVWVCIGSVFGLPSLPNVADTEYDVDAVLILRELASLAMIKVSN